MSALPVRPRPKGAAFLGNYSPDGATQDAPVRPTCCSARATKTTIINRSVSSGSSPICDRKANRKNVLSQLPVEFPVRLTRVILRWLENTERTLADTRRACKLYVERLQAPLHHHPKLDIDIKMLETSPTVDST